MTGKKGMVKGIRSVLCSKCKKIKELETKKYCRKCSAEYIRNWRKNNPLTIKQKFKDNVRHKTNMRIRRGLLIPKPCEKCGNIDVEAHHEDYNKPYNVCWLCFKCHRQHHKDEKEFKLNAKENKKTHCPRSRRTKSINQMGKA